MLDGPQETGSPYPADEGRRADHPDYEGYPADPDFQLRGGFENLMLDAATPLFGLAIRLNTLDDLPNIAYVHKTVQNQVRNIREEIRQHGYSVACKRKPQLPSKAHATSRTPCWSPAEPNGGRPRCPGRASPRRPD
ncbi:hypothetical protein STW0522PSE72_27370 [Pseudomonas monteilii]|nr:hypothetical protein STW0522PSE72_27370 [Pseudomonas monteilii]